MELKVTIQSVTLGLAATETELKLGAGALSKNLVWYNPRSVPAVRNMASPLDDPVNLLLL